MKTEDRSKSWQGGELTREELYWEQALEESRQLLIRQNQALETKREILTDFTRYHFLFLGLLFATVKFGNSGGIQIHRWEIFLASMPSLAGILLSHYGHRSLGSYNIGFTTTAFHTLQSKSETYSEALKSISEHYEDMAEKNRTRIHQHEKFRVWNLILLAVGFGVLLGSITF